MATRVRAPVPRRMVLDCDPGIDDAVAMLLALARSEWSVEGFSIVGGNTTLSNAVRAAGQVLTVAGRAEVPVRGGMSRPLVRELRTGAQVHGESGLGGRVELPEPAVPAVDEHAVDWLVRELAAARASGAGLEVAATGPLTNLAMAFRRDPDAVHGLRRLVIMGGSIGHGNATPAAEYNVLADPEAAEIVLSSGAQPTMVGLDVTLTAIVPAARIAELRGWGTPVGTLCADLLEHYLGFQRRQYGHDGVPIHDACAVAALLQPELVETRHLRVDVETSSRFCDGRTVVDLWEVTGREPNAHVATSIDVDAFTGLLFESLRRYRSDGRAATASASGREEGRL